MTWYQWLASGTLVGTLGALVYAEIRGWLLYSRRRPEQDNEP